MSVYHKVFKTLLSDTDRLMALMLLSLHALLTWGENSLFFHALLFCHYGFFLLWQPILRPHKILTLRQIFMIIGVVAIAAVFLKSVWFIAFWIAGLFSLIGGKALASHSKDWRLPKILAAFYLLAILFIWVVPKLINTAEDLTVAEYLLNYLLPALPLSILCMPAAEKTRVAARNIDFFYTLLLFLMLAIVILSSFAIGVIWHLHYFKLLMVVTAGLALMLIAISWLWNPSKTFSGLELLMSRYLVSLGLPFEQWLKNIAYHAHTAPSSEYFLEAAIKEVTAFSWVSGIVLQHANLTHVFGNTSKHISHYVLHPLHITLYSRWQFSPAMYMHVQLLMQILREFYEAKCREETITRNTYVQTVYETGSRLTHDIKNILQSLANVSTALEDSESNEDDAKLMALIRTQLPRLSKRLNNTLSKLERPHREQENLQPIRAWWSAFQQGNQHYPIVFKTPAQFPLCEVNADVIDSVVDNVLQNALLKTRREPGIEITVNLMPTSYFCLEITDTGSAIAAEIARRLFKSHIVSTNGFGVGLYHAAQQAKLAGYALQLINNEDGKVCFRLESLVH